MKTVRILCGGYGHAVNGVVKLISAGQTVEVDDAEAARLVAIGAGAMDVATPTGWQEGAETGESTSDGDPDSNAQETPPVLDEAKLLSMTNDELKKLGEEMGADVSKCRKKADFVAAILAAQDIPDKGEDLPDLSAEDPV